jgi:HK97 family phage major capsid protein
MSDKKKEEVVEENTDNVQEEVEKNLEKHIKSVFSDEKKGISESIKEEIQKDVQKILDEHKKKMEKKTGVYSEESKKNLKRKVANKFLREGLKSLINGQATEEFEAVQKEMTTDDTATPFSGYITDSFLSAEIRHLVTQYGVAAREFTTVTFMESSYRANNLVTDPTGFWVDEAGSIKSTEVVLGQETLTLKKLATIVTLTRELLQEQEIDFISFIGSRVAEVFAKMEDEAFFIGDGTSTYGGFTGLLNNTSVNEVTMADGDGDFTDLTVKYMRDMQDATPQGAHANAKYYMHRSILNIVRNLREDAVSAGDQAGAYLVKQPMGDVAMNIDGYPIVLVEVMPKSSATAVDTSFVLFGDLKKATIRGTRGGIVADRFNSGSVRNVANSADLNLITTDREAVRWINQVGYITIIPSAVTKLTTSSTSN